MRPAAVDPAVLERFQGYSAIVVLADGVANGATDPVSDALLREAERAAPEPGHPHLLAWREAFASAGIKAKRHPSSAAALARRARSAEGLPRISRLVDLYNAISVRHVLPVGGEDRDALRGVDTLRLATGAEPCDVRGSTGEPEPATPGEPVWADDAGITCRRWSWRQGERTRLTERTGRALFVLEAMAPYPPEALRAAADDLAAHLRTWWPQAAVEDFELP